MFIFINCNFNIQLNLFFSCRYNNEEMNKPKMLVNQANYKFFDKLKHNENVNKLGNQVLDTVQFNKSKDRLEQDKNYQTNINHTLYY